MPGRALLAWLPAVVLLCCADPVSGQIPATDAATAASVAKAQSAMSQAEIVWQKRVADVVSDPQKADSEAYQAKLDAAEQELADAQLQLQLAHRSATVTKNVRHEVRHAVSTIHEDSREEVGTLQAQRVVMDERNDALRQRVRMLQQQRDKLEHFRKVGKLQAELQVTAALESLGDGIRREARLKQQQHAAGEQLFHLREDVFQLKKLIHDSKTAKQDLLAANVRLEQLGQQRSEAHAGLSSASYIGDVQAGGWYDAQNQGVCNDFCRDVSETTEHQADAFQMKMTVALKPGPWRCALAGGAESGHYAQADLTVCEHKGAFSNTAKGRVLAKLEKDMDSTMLDISRLSGLTQAVDVQKLREESLQKQGDVAATEERERLLKQSLDEAASSLQSERITLGKKVSDEGRIAALQEQLSELTAKKARQNEQIVALTEASRLAAMSNPPLQEVFSVNKKLAAAGLLSDKLIVN